MSFSAVVFDMDGVLVDNNEYHYRSFEIFCQKYKLPISPEIYNTHITGRTNEMILHYLFDSSLSSAEISALAYEKEAIYRDIFRQEIKPADGLMAFLEFLKTKSIVCAVASNGPIENIDFVLDEINIRPYFTAIVNAAMVAKGKPAPDIYLKAALLLNKKPQECIVFEDSPTGIAAARAAQIQVIGLSTTHTTEELQDTLFICKNFLDPKIKEMF